MEKGWPGLPYHTIAEHYNRLFGKKIYKIPVTVVDNCPNRMGLKGMQTCVFCDVWGSAANAEAMTLELKTQIEKYHEAIARKYKAKNFLVYFQAYTNTFTKVTALRHNFDIALSYDFTQGLVIGTRPDCLSKAVLELWQEYHERSFVAVEMGVQSFDNEQLRFLRRGHTAEASIEAIHRIAESTDVDLGIHLIFGNPGESDEQMVRTAEIVNSLPVTNVKLHNLHVLKNTPLEEMHARGEFAPVDFATYARRVEIFLQHLSPRLAVHRLAAYAPRWEELVAPAWTADKMGTHQRLIDFLREKKSYQSELYSAQNEDEIQKKEELCKKSRPSFLTHA